MPASSSSSSVGNRNGSSNSINGNSGRISPTGSATGSQVSITSSGFEEEEEESAYAIQQPSTRVMTPMKQEEAQFVFNAKKEMEMKREKIKQAREAQIREQQQRMRMQKLREEHGNHQDLEHVDG